MKNVSYRQEIKIRTASKINRFHFKVSDKNSDLYFKLQNPFFFFLFRDLKANAYLSVFMKPFNKYNLVLLIYSHCYKYE